MDEPTLLFAILGLVALGLCAQAAALLAAVRALQRLELRLDRAERELLALRPRLERLGQIIEDVGAWTAAATEQLPRVSAGIENTLDSLGGMARLGATVFMKPLRPLGAALAIWQGLKSGANVYRRVVSARRAPSLHPAEPSDRDP